MRAAHANRTRLARGLRAQHAVHDRLDHARLRADPLDDIEHVLSRLRLGLVEPVPVGGRAAGGAAQQSATIKKSAVCRKLQVGLGSCASGPVQLQAVPG